MHATGLIRRHQPVQFSLKDWNSDFSFHWMMNKSPKGNNHSPESQQVQPLDKVCIDVMSFWCGSGRFGFHFREIGVYFREILCRHLKCVILHVFLQHHHIFCQIWMNLHSPISLSSPLPPPSALVSKCIVVLSAYSWDTTNVFHHPVKAKIWISILIFKYILYYQSDFWLHISLLIFMLFDINSDLT